MKLVYMGKIMTNEFDKKPLTPWPNAESSQQVMIPQSRKSTWAKRHWYTVPDYEGRTGMHGSQVGDGDFAPDMWRNYLDIE